jgi:CRP-like cAMP-binding protein
MTAIAEFFQRFFADSAVQPPWLPALLPLCRQVTFMADERIVTQADAVHTFYWIGCGQVDLTDGDKPLKCLSSEQLLGDDVVFNHKTQWAYTATARVKTDVIAIDAKGFMAILDKYPCLGLSWLKAVSQQYYQLEQDALTQCLSTHDAVDPTAQEMDCHRFPFLDMSAERPQFEFFIH